MYDPFHYNIVTSSSTTVFSSLSMATSCHPVQCIYSFIITVIHTTCTSRNGRDPIWLGWLSNTSKNTINKTVRLQGKGGSLSKNNATMFGLRHAWLMYIWHEFIICWAYSFIYNQSCDAYLATTLILSRYAQCSCILLCSYTLLSFIECRSFETSLCSPSPSWGRSASLALSFLLSSLATPAFPSSSSSNSGATNSVEFTWGPHPDKHLIGEQL